MDSQTKRKIILNTCYTDCRGIYAYIYSKLKEKAIARKIEEKTAIDFLHEWRLPRGIRIITIKELEILGWIERVSRFEFKFNKCPIDINDTNKIYKSMGIKVTNNIVTY